MKKKFIIAFALLTSIWLMYHTKTDNLQNDITKLIPLNNIPEKRLFSRSQDPKNINSYPDKLMKTLLAFSDEELQTINCSEKFIRNWEALFFLYNPQTAKYNISLPHEQLIEMTDALEKKLPFPYKDNKKFLLGRICKTQDNMTLLEYHRGTQEQFFDNYVYLGEKINSFLFITDNGSAFNKHINMTNAEQKHTLHCLPLQLTKTRLLFYQCTTLDETTATTWFYRMNLEELRSDLILTCNYSYTPPPSKLCV
jgi:hypothetical protein